MEFKLLTLRWSPALGAIDDAPLLALASHHEVLSIREHLVLVHDVPNLVCLVSCQPRAAVATTARAPTTTPSQPRAPIPTPSAGEPATRPPDDQRTYDTIRRWRAEQAHHDGVPRYVVLTNRNIDALVRERPVSLAALARIPGIGPAKVERHGQALLALLHPRPGIAPVQDAIASEGSTALDVPSEDPAA